jgi:hypothetical protein
VSDLLRRLRDGAREVEGFHDDLSAPVFARQDWRGTTFTRRSLGDGLPVEVWYLAEHFLLAWHDWRALRESYIRYFGQPPSRFPRSWDALNRRCLDLANRLLRDAHLDEIIEDSWVFGPTAEVLIADGEPPSATSVYHQVVTNHRRLSLLERADAWLEPPGTQQPLFDLLGHERVGARDRIWPKSREAAQQLNGRLRLLWPDLPRQVRDACLWHLRHYQQANLLASWLLADTPLMRDRPQSALLYALNREQIVHPTIEDFARRLQIGEDDRRSVNQILHRVTDAIAQFGYASFVEDVTSGEFLGGESSAVGSDAINIIPNKNMEKCCTTLLAVSRGIEKRSRLSFSKVMVQVKAHLIECADNTRVVIFLCDHWSPTMLDDNLDELRAHHRRGARFLFLLAGMPDRGVAPLSVDLGAAP